MDIRCRKTTCKYNETHSCFAKGIKISKTVQCDTYMVDDKKDINKNNKSNDMSKTMFDVPIKDSPHRSRKTINIRCEATQCLFNKEGVCQANGVTINDLGEPYCMIFLEK